MNEALQLLWLPFAASLVLVVVHAYFGLQVLARQVIFVDLALAQAAALGATLAFLLGHAPQMAGSYGWSLLFALGASALLTATRFWAGRIPQEALIGVIYVVTAAAAFLLVDKAPQGTEHIKQMLTGNILTVAERDLFVVIPLYAAIAGLHAWATHRGWLGGTPARDLLGDFAFYACFAVVVTSSVALAGVLLVFSFLIIPAAIGVLYATRTPWRLAIGWVAGAVASAAGLAASYVWDMSTGAAMVCAFGVVLALAGLLHPLIAGGNARCAWVRGMTGLRWAIAFLLAASSLWWAVAPRADQPLADSLERLLPELRGLYMTEREIAVVDEAAAYAERYRTEAELLNTQEAESRWNGHSLTDDELRKISSFLQSYNEMRKGEEFVQREARARARERHRWHGGLTGLLLALPIAPLRWRRLRSSRPISPVLPSISVNRP
ncbi:MAG: metal ABC transporter permease [Thiobacillus sp.]